MREQTNLKTIVFMLYPGLTVLDLIGPLEVFSSSKRLREADFRIVAAGERIEPLETDTPVKVAPNVTLSEVPRPYGVIVPGGSVPTLRAMSNRALTGYLSEAAETAEFVGSVCTGALILAAAGLLEGRKATTHWAHYRTLEQLGATYVRRRWVEDGKFITAAGVSAGIDMGLHLLGRILGQRAAQETQIDIEYQPEPPFGPIDWTLVDQREAGDARLELAREVLSGDPELSRRLSAGL